MLGWLSSIKAAKRPSTWVQYNQVTRSYILPSLGHLKVKDLRPEHIQGMYTRLLEQGLGVYTVLKIHTVLHSALQQAVKTGIIGRNPAAPHPSTKRTCNRDGNPQRRPGEHVPHRLQRASVGGALPFGSSERYETKGTARVEMERSGLDEANHQGRAATRQTRWRGSHVFCPQNQVWQADYRLGRKNYRLAALSR